MIGIGKWEGEIRTPFFKGKGTVEIKEKDGKYIFLFDLPDKYKNAEIFYDEIKEIGTDTLFIVVRTSAFPGKKAQIKVTFNGDKMYGSIKVNILGGITVPIHNGRRVTQ